MQAEGEVALLVALDEGDGFVGKEIVGKAFERFDFTILFEIGVFGGDAAGSHSHEIVEAKLGGVTAVGVAEVPFTYQTSSVAMLLELFCPGGQIRVEARTLAMTIPQGTGICFMCKPKDNPLPSLTRDYIAVHFVIPPEPKLIRSQFRIPDLFSWFLLIQKNGHEQFSNVPQFS